MYTNSRRSSNFLDALVIFKASSRSFTSLSYFVSSTRFLYQYTFSLQFFYTSKPVDGCGFLRKHKYTVSLLIFNLVVYLLLVADIIATPLISDQEQVQMSGIISTIFAVLFFVILVGFLHYAIRLFFRVSTRAHTHTHTHTHTCILTARF